MTLKKAARQGMVQGLLGTRGELGALRVTLQNTVRAHADQLASFRVHPQYEELERRANELTKEIHDLENSNVAESRLLNVYESSVEGEHEPAPEAVAQLYEEAGIVLSDAVKRRLEDVHTFHRRLLNNRREFLRQEMGRLAADIEHRRERSRKLSVERADLLQTLQTHRALDEYTRLNAAHVEDVARLRDIELRIQRLRDFEEGQSEVTIKQEELQRQARNDLEDRQPRISQAISLFNEHSQALYHAPGKLVIDVTPSGYKFNVEIERSGSQGIDSMKIFCYDLMLARLWAEHEPNPGVLIHDSMIFDGVDERQIALALELAHSESTRRGFQYICTLNSDTLPHSEFSEGFDIGQFVRLRLTDTSTDGSLFGIRF